VLYLSKYASSPEIAARVLVTGVLSPPPLL